MSFKKRIKILFRLTVGAILCFGGYQFVNLTNPNIPWGVSDFFGIICSIIGFFMIMFSEGVGKRLNN